MDARNLQFMFYGFAAAWGIVIAYLFLLARREKRLRDDISRLKELLQDDDAKSRRNSF